MGIKMIVSDLDGTLFDSDQKGYEVSAELVALVKQFQQNGKIFTIATGRSNEASLAVAQKLELQVPYIAYNGAQIVYRDGSVLYSDTFDMTNWLGFLKSLQRLGASIVFTQNNRLVCLDYTKRITQYEEKEKIKCGIADLQLLESPMYVNKLLIIGDIKTYIKLWEKLDEDFKASFRYVISEEDYMEIIRKEVSKGSALKKLKAHLGVKDEEVLSIGNHMNDKELLEEAFIGVAVANAIQELKNVADYVTTGVYEQGVIEVIKKYI